MDGLHATVVGFCLLFVLVEGYSRGPPVADMPEICNSMLPGHGPSPQSSTDKVTITLGNDCYKEGHTIPVTVKFNDGNMAGIFVQSRQTEGNFTENHGYGSFESSGDSQPMKAYTCWGNQDSAWGHSAKLSSSSVSFNWVAPSPNKGDMQFAVTLVKEKAIFWTWQKSAEIKYKSDCVEVSKAARSISTVSCALVAALTIITAPLC